MSKDLLTLRGVEVGYHGRPLLPAVDLAISSGTYLGIVGPNGAGKTTLVKTMLGLLPPVGGQVDLPLGRRPRFGYVPQRSNAEQTFPLTLMDMVLMGRYPRVGVLRRPGPKAGDGALDAIRRVGLGGLERRPLHTLSGGQFQRALIARALATEPEVLVLDEPTTGMDLVAEQSILTLVGQLQSAFELAVVMITHQLGLVASYAREVLLLDKERQLVDHGPVEDVVTGERLSRVYGRPVSVEESRGFRRVHLEVEP